MSQDQLQALQQQVQALTQHIQQNQPATNPTATGWGQQPTSAPSASSISIPIKMENNGQSIRVYLQFALANANPETIGALLGQLAGAGLPLDTFQVRNSGGWGGNNSNSNGWGGNNNRGGGGYGRRY